MRPNGKLLAVRTNSSVENQAVGAVKMKRIFFFLLMMTCSVSWAAWELTKWSGGGQDIIFHDKSTRIRDGDVVTMWTMIDYFSPKTDEKTNKYRSTKMRIAYDCKRENYTVTAGARYSELGGKGKLLGELTVNENELKWIAVIPDSLAKTELRIACGKK